MSCAPEGIWIDAWGGNWSPVSGGTQEIQYTRTDLIAAMIEEAVQAEREACAVMIEQRADYLDDAIKCGGSKEYLNSLDGGRIELRSKAAAIRARKGGEA